MANELRVWDIGFCKAVADYRTKQHLFMTLSAADTVTITGAGGIILGVLQNKPNINRACEIRRLGITKITAGDTIAVGDKLKSDSAGRAVTASTGDMYGGICLEAATVNLTATMLMEIGTI